MTNPDPPATPPDGTLQATLTVAPAPVPSPEARPAPGVPAAPETPDAPVTTVTWTAVVTADRSYYESVHAVDAEDSSSMAFPAYVPQRRFRLAGSVPPASRRKATSSSGSADDCQAWSV